MADGGGLTPLNHPTTKDTYHVGTPTGQLNACTHEFSTPLD